VAELGLSAHFITIPQRVVEVRSRPRAVVGIAIERDCLSLQRGAFLPRARQSEARRCHTWTGSPLQADMNRLAFLALAGAGCASVPLPAIERSLPPLGAPDSRAIAIVRVPAPWWAPRFFIIRKFTETIPDYVAVEGLEHKAYTLSEDGRYGGVYLWESRAAATTWFSPAWHERLKKSRGVDGDVQILDARWTVSGTANPEGDPLPQHGLRTDAAVTWLSGAAAPAGELEGRLRALAAAHGQPAGLIRLSFVSTSDGAPGAVALWASRDAAQAFWTTDRKARLAQVLDAPVRVTWFCAPVLLDAAGARREQSMAQQP
jgi:hypothetical protein